MKDKEVSKIAEKIVDWNTKNKFLKNEISKLENAKTFPIFTIIAFLLKSQLIEFELKQLITSLDQHIHFSSTSKILKRKTRTPKELDDKRMTLGRLKDEVLQFEGNFLDDLKNSLSTLVDLRNTFVHKLFNPGTINELIKNSAAGLNLANKIISEVELIEKSLKKNDSLKK